MKFNTNTRTSRLRCDQPNFCRGLQEEPPRFYCWRVGGPSLTLEGKCDECGASNHELLKPNQCGQFVALDTRGGRPCSLERKHEGPCASEE